ncbi:LuxR C-terminal-related transcriptional regulator [Microbacterium sp. zg.Y625]|uniref:helix-turn-helix transcriptional regulator n=1 Tax=Microbacterium jiangjiandongii TaxID=3049071 RepID=UPI00214ACE0F|nr:MULTISPECIES: LuxR family transcriptional regulator [unclassified Microbacterium]MCR2793062.1 LuxR C-terminal-related transcriptional regulator [Microbacterium sp. zg.Y625]WIM24174.1 LuxR C-terminal-related transcriptional regulator [Microbacterium sp. zg-Y625]
MPSPDTRAQLIDTISEAVHARTCVVLVGLPGSGRRDAMARLRVRFADEDWTIASVTGFHADGPPLESLALSGFAPPAPAATAALAAATQALASLSAERPALLLIEQADQLDEASTSAVAAAIGIGDLTAVASIRPPFPGYTRIEAALSRRETTALWMPALPFEDIHRLISDALGGSVNTDAAGRIYALSGGLPGIARSIAVEARRAGRLVRRGAQWSAERDLWSPALAVTLSRFADGLTEAERDGCWILAELGPSSPETVRQALPWSVVTALDDRGLVRFVDADAGSLVALFPPVLEDHLRHRARSARGRQAAELVATGRAAAPETPTRRPESERPALHAPLGWSSSPEAAAILGRVLREDAARRVAITREDWQEKPTAVTAVAHLQALVDDAAGPQQVDAVLSAVDNTALPPDRDTVRLRIWEIIYRALVRHDPHGAMALLDRTRREIPVAVTVLNAIEQHIRLVVTGIGPAELPPYPTAAEIDEVHRLSRPSPSLSLPRSHAVDVVRLVRGEVLLSGARTSDALADFADLSPTDPLRRDPYSIPSLAQLCDGDIEGAVRRSQRELDLARGTLDRTRIEPHGYVVALGLLLQGRLGTLRDHLTSMFAVNAPAVLVPDSRAGLLSISAALSLWEANLPSARAMVAQVEDLELSGGPFPLIGADVSAAALAVARGVPPAEATRAAWERTGHLIDEGHLLAAVFDGVRLIDLHVDLEATARLTQVAYSAQGTLLPALGAFLEGAVAQSPDQLLAAAGTLREQDLGLYGTRAHAMAIRRLRDAGRADDAARESQRLRRAVQAAGDDLSLLLSARFDPATVLTPREREVARLIAAGGTNRDVAEKLVVSERTIDNHLYRIFRKLGVNTREELAGLV